MQLKRLAMRQTVC